MLYTVQQFPQGQKRRVEHLGCPLRAKQMKMGLSGETFPQKQGVTISKSPNTMGISFGSV